METTINKNLVLSELYKLLAEFEEEDSARCSDIERLIEKIKKL